MTFRATVVYGPEQGLAAAYREWRCDTGRKLVHGTVLRFDLTFEARYVDDDGEVIDPDRLNTFRTWLRATFDGKLLVASDDPALMIFRDLADKGLADMIELPGVGRGSFAHYVACKAVEWLRVQADGLAARVRLVSVECREPTGRSATYTLPESK